MIRKTRPQTRPHFSCHHSLSWIAEYALNELRQNQVDCQFLWVVDNNEFCFENKIPKDSCIDILLTGSFFLRILELPFWPVQEMRIWVMCEDIKNILIDVFKIPQESIGIIPHPKVTTNIQTTTELKHFVYAGRLSWGKNIEALLALTSYLQQTTHPDLTLDLFGEKSDLPEESYGRIEQTQFDINELILLYPWKKSPRLMGNDPKWFEKLGSDSTYISLSTSMYEDFALSPTEALQRGTPLVLSQWGGHKHKEGAKLLKPSYIFNSFEPSWIKEKKTKLLANDLLSSSQILGRNANFIVPQKSTQQHISALVMDHIQHQAPEILLCFREAIDVYADTFKGRNFFYLYKKYFSSQETPDEIVFYDEQKQDLSLSGQVMFIPLHDAHLPEVMRWKLKARRVIDKPNT